MARMTHEDAKQFENRSQFDSFSLSDDGDSAKVQFLVDSSNDVLTYTTHEIPMIAQSGREYKRKVSCLKNHKDDPAGTCPLCDAGKPIKVARYVPMFDIENGKATLWERGPRFCDSQLAGFFSRARANGSDIKNLVVEIVRQGKKGDKSTTYALYPMERIEPVDTANVEIPEPEGSLIATWTPAEMENYISNGVVPTSNNNSQTDPNVGAKPRNNATTASGEGYHSHSDAPTLANDMSSFDMSANSTASPEDYF